MFVCKSRPSLRLGLLAWLAIAFWTPVFGENIEELKAKAAKGDSQAQNNLGAAYIFGQGVEKNPELGLSLLHKAAASGELNACIGLSLFYENGDYLPIDLKKSFELKLKAAKAGDFESQERVVNAYTEGIGVDKNPEEAKKWKLTAIDNILNKANSGNLDSQYLLAKSYVYGWGLFGKNLSLGIEIMKKAAEAGHLEAQTELGTILSYKGYFLIKDKSIINEEKAKYWLLKAGSNGSLKAQISLAQNYESGVNGFDQNIDEAIKWYYKAAKNGDDVSYDLAKKLENNKNIRKQKSAKQALLIANSNYSQFGGLANTGSDAQKLSKTLQVLGFEVSILQNASREAMLDALKQFEEKVRGTDALAFFHYGGHGVQVDGKNYLIPADAEIPDERRVATRAVDLDEVIASIEMAKPKASVLVVDACRHNPLPASATRAATRGLAVVGRKPKNSVIIFAAEAGNEALDGLFTPILAKNLQEHSDKSLNQIMQKVRTEVFDKSNGAQTPGEYNQLFEELYFRQPAN